MQYATFTDLGFVGMNPSGFTTYADIPVNAGGFKLTGVSGWEEGFKFLRCRFGYFNTAFDFEGTGAPNSDMEFVTCKFHFFRSTVYLINSTQSVNHEFFGCDIDSCYGDVFGIGANGGGAIKMYGGNVTLFSDTGVVNYFCNFPNSVAGVPPMIFHGLRLSLAGNTSKLITLGPTSSWDIWFHNCFLSDNGTVSKSNWCKVDSFGTINFRDCYFYEPGGTPITMVSAATTGPSGQSGTINLNHCALSDDFSDRCTVNAFGKISASQCYTTNIGGTGHLYAADFDMHWANSVPGQFTVWDNQGPGTLRSDGSYGDNQWRLKTAQVKLLNDSWPTVVEQTVKLPKNAIIKGLHLRKPAGSLDTTATTFRISDNTKTTHHLTTASVAFNAAVSADVDNYFYHVGTAVNDRTLRLNSSAVTTGVLQGGVVVVEYY
jgi:hypothetical protein